MLNMVLGRLLFFNLRVTPSTLPSRESSLVLRVSGSANMTDPLLLVGEGGPASNWTAERMGRFKASFVSVSALDACFDSTLLFPPNGFSISSTLVGREGVHRDHVCG